MAVSALEPDANRRWDPGGAHETIPLIATNLYAILSSADSRSENDESSRTELDSHANMGVVGRHAYVLAYVGKDVEVRPYSPDYEPIRKPLVDAAIQYDDPYTGLPYILVARNMLYVPSMSNNLIPPFMLREAGINVRDTPKIHVASPTTEDHAITFKETGFRIAV